MSEALGEPQVEDPQINLAISNLALPLRLQLAGSIRGYENYASKLTAGGNEVSFEVTPSRSRFVMSALSLEAMLNEEGDEPHRPARYEEQALWGLIGSVHSSFRLPGSNNLMDKFFPDWQTSVNQMQRLHQVAGHKLLAVLYPNLMDIEPDLIKGPYAFQEATFQPKPNVFRHWALAETSSIDDIEQAMLMHGYAGVVGDVTHIQLDEEDKARFNDPLELMTRLSKAGLVHEVHLALNRFDLIHPDDPLALRTRQAKEAFMHSAQTAEKTLEGEMLMQIVRDWKRLGTLDTSPRRIVYEEPPLKSESKRRRLRDQQAIFETTRLLIEAV